MSDAVRPHLTPEEEHLGQQERLLEELTEQLAIKEEEFTSTGADFARFRIHYLRRFAPLYAELDRLEAEIARRASVAEDTPEARSKAREASARAAESEQAQLEAGAELAAEEGPRAAPSDDLRSLFRQAAKRLHPDLATDDADRARRTAVMASLNAAYAAGDEAAMRRILDGEAARPEAVTGDDTGARLVRVLRKIAQVRARFTELVQLTEALEADPLYRLFAQCREVWNADEDPLAEDEADLRTRIASAHAQLAALAMADARRPRPDR